jgi:DNA-binding transcriptional regulator YhcF (GntR family)
MFWKKVDGINLWKINRVFNKLAYSKAYLEEKIKNGVVVIELAPKKTRELTNSETKREIEEKVKQTEGFEVFRLCLLEDCQPVYKEKVTMYGVSRWLEIPLKYSY